MITITLDARRSQDQLNLLALPPQKRKRLVWRAEAELKKLAARHVRQQQDPNGKPWAPRKRGKRKMLRGLPKLLEIHAPSQDVAELGFKRGTMNAHAGVIANTHQKGHRGKPAPHLEQRRQQTQARHQGAGPQAARARLQAPGGTQGVIPLGVAWLAHRQSQLRPGRIAHQEAQG